MSHHMRSGVAFLVLILAGGGAWAAPAKKRAMTVDDLLLMARVGDPQLSPDGKQVAYTLTTTDKDTLARVSHLWLVPADASSRPRPLTFGDKGAWSPRWTPDGRSLAFLSARAGTPQIWLLPLAAGGEARRVTELSTGADGPLVVSPDGTRVAFVSDVDPSCADDACNKRKAEAREKGSRVHHATSLYFRHWTEWRDDWRRHVMVADLATGKAIDVTPGDFDAPPHLYEDGGIAWSPDGKDLCFVSNREGRDREAYTTNSDLWTVPAGGGKATRRTTNAGGDVEPHYTPDGKAIVFRSQARAGFESDRWRLTVLDRATGATREVFRTPEVSPGEVALSPDGRSAFFVADKDGREDLFAVDLAAGSARNIHAGGGTGSINVAPGGRAVIYAASTLTAPVDLWRLELGADGTASAPPRRLTDHNRAFLDVFDAPVPESFTVKGAGGDPVQSWLLKPPGFSASKKYPVVFLIHGGPQGSWSDSWNYRWNPALWAAQGWVVVTPNPRGSTGFGQRFVDEISRDWAGKVMQDMTAVFDATVKLGYVDGTRQAIAGASYGGYAVDWLIGHSDRFKAAVTHDGVYNLPSMVTVTEELWFAEWDLGGPAWTKEGREMLDRVSPHNAADRIKTPTLVITNDLDFRVPVDQGIQLFQTLRRRGIPSELLDFPDEGHWVLKARNSKIWHDTAFAWLKRWLR